MGSEHILQNKAFKAPNSLFDQIIRDIPVDIWARIIHNDPILKRAVLEGFSDRPDKLRRFLKTPQIKVRLRHLLRTEPDFLDNVILTWGDCRHAVTAFLEMLDPSFVNEEWVALKNFLGPERFCAALYLMGHLQDEGFRERVGEDFWERRMDPRVAELAAPVTELWEDYRRAFPEAAEPASGAYDEIPLEGGRPLPEGLQGILKAGDNAKELQRKCREEEDRRHKVEKKLGKAQEKAASLEEELNRRRRENEALRKEVRAWEESFRQQVEERLHEKRLEWFRRYHEAGLLDGGPLEKAEERLDAVFKRADRALELQKQADEQYGVVSAVRRRLIQVDLYLEQMERIYADSLMVHPEVRRAKESLIREKNRLLSLPGVEKLFRRDPELLSPDDLRRRLHLLEPAPDSLPKLRQFKEIAGHLEALGLMDDARSLQEEIHQKKRQILEALYGRFEPHPAGKPQPFQSFEDFVESGLSRQYDLYVDGYNILLKAQADEHGKDPSRSLSRLREELVSAVSRKAGLFRKVHLFFDGVEEFRDRQGNMEIIYTDKKRGVTADAAIIQAVKGRHDRKAVLVTEDRGIIRDVEGRIHAVLGPYHFFAFVFDVKLPLLESEERQ